ncbi:MAG: hypothetical protein QXZ70_04100 [Candidatus Bathyarchaeia archaeon]
MPNCVCPSPHRCSEVYPVVAKQYLAVYEEVLKRHRQQQSPGR